MLRFVPLVDRVQVVRHGEQSFLYNDLTQEVVALPPQAEPCEIRYVDDAPSGKVVGVEGGYSRRLMDIFRLRPCFAGGDDDMENLVIVDSKNGQQKPLLELRQAYTTTYMKVPSLAATNILTMKVNIMSMHRDGANLFWTLSDIQRCMGLTTNYIRGGQLSCRWILDRWPRWTARLEDVSLPPAQHMLKCRVLGEHQHPDRFLEEHAISSFAMLVILAKGCAGSHSEVDKEKFGALLSFFLRRLSDPPLTLYLAPGKFVTPVTACHEWMAAEGVREVVVSKGRIVSVAQLMGCLPPRQQKSLQFMVAHSGASGDGAFIDAGQLMAAISAKPFGWLLNQFAVGFGLALESQVSEKAGWCELQASPLVGAEALVGRKRKDLQLCSALVEQPRVRRRIKGPEARADAAVVAGMNAQMPTSTKADYEGLSNECYMEAAADLFQGIGDCRDLSMCADASRIGGNDTMLSFAGCPQTGQVVVLPPQAMIVAPTLGMGGFRRGSKSHRSTLEVLPVSSGHALFRNLAPPKKNLKSA